MKNQKHRPIPDHRPFSYDDVRTIPDFYDNLYPANDCEENVLLSTSFVVKKFEKVKKSEKKRENHPDDE